MYAFDVIGDHLDDAAIAYATVVALFDHPLELGAKRFEPSDAALNILQTATGDAVGLMTALLRLGRQGEELTNVSDFEAQLAGVTNEVQPIHFGRSVPTLLTFGARGTFQQPDLLIVADGWHLYLGATRQLTD